MRTNRFHILCCFCTFLFTAPVAWAENLRVGDTELSVKNQQIIVSKKGKPVIKLTEIAFNFQKLATWKIATATSDTIVLRGQLPAAVDFYNVVENVEPRPVEITISKVNGGFRLYSEPEWGRQISLGFEYLGDHFFGLSAPLQPNNQLSPNLTGGFISVDVNSEDALIQENFASAFSSFYMSSHGYGAFFDTFARGVYQFAINGTNRIHHDTGVLDWYIFPGNNGTEIHQAYFSLIGEPKKVPAWGLGPIGWRDHNTGAAEILDDIEKMNALEIPFTSWFVDRPYSDGTHAWSAMNFSKDFADPQKWIAKIREDYGMEFMTWVATTTFGDKRFEKHLDGGFSYIDLSHEGSVQAYQQELVNNQYQYGVKGHKIDRADEGFPVYELWHDGTSTAERRNKYAWLMAKIHDENLQKTWGDDQVTFARTAIHRTQPYLSAIWGGDPRTSWQGLQSNFANAMRSSFMGFPVWGTDVGGYQGDGFIPEDLYLRWMQAGSMTGLFEIKLDGAGGSGRDRMPWQYDKTFQERFKAICDDRMLMVPYLYSLASTSAQTGALMQPLAYRHLDDRNTWDNWDQFYVGDAILVAPIFDSGTSRKVYLPKGEWRDFDNATTRFTGGKQITVEAGLDKLPRFVKANSLYVTGNVYRGSDRVWDNAEAALTIHAFPARQDSQTEFFYADINDQSELKTIALAQRKGRVTLTSPAIANKVNIELALAKAPKAVTLNGAQVKIAYDTKSGLLSVPVPASSSIELAVTL